MMIVFRVNVRDSLNVLKKVCCWFCIFCSWLVSVLNVISKREWWILFGYSICFVDKSCLVRYDMNEE